MSEGQPVKLVLPRRKDAKLFDEPVVERAIIIELQSAHGMRNAFDGIRLPVRVIGQRVNAPLIAGTTVLQVQNSIHALVTQVEIWRAHVDLRTQRSRAIRELSLFH